MEEDDWHEGYESDDTESELDQVLPPLPRIFNFLRESMSEREENFSDTESVCSNGEQTAESALPEPDEQTRTSACEHQVVETLLFCGKRCELSVQIQVFFAVSRRVGTNPRTNNYGRWFYTENSVVVSRILCYAGSRANVSFDGM